MNSLPPRAATSTAAHMPDPGNEPQGKQNHAGIGIGVGIAVGVALGVAFDQLALGTVFEAALDVASHPKRRTRQ